TADHLAEVVGVHVHLDGPPAPAGDQLDADVIGVGDDAAHQVLDGIGDDGAHYSAASASVASAAASSFLAFFFGVTASATGSFSAAASAALNSSSLDGFAGLVLRVPSVPGRPLNFCQSPVISSRRCTGSVGWAPTLSQYCTRSESISMSEGSSFGWYLPMDSMARPSRRVRASATTTRYWGLRILPRRVSLMRTAMLICLFRVGGRRLLEMTARMVTARFSDSHGLRARFRAGSVCPARGTCPETG